MTDQGARRRFVQGLRAVVVRLTNEAAKVAGVMGMEREKRVVAYPEAMRATTRR